MLGAPGQPTPPAPDAPTGQPPPGDQPVPVVPPVPAYGSETTPTTVGPQSFVTGRWGSRLALIIGVLIVVTLAVSFLI